MARIGAHFHVDHPLNEAIACGADAAQFFLGDPQGWKGPVVPGGDPAAVSAAYAEAGIVVYIHAPYVINVATSNNRIRIPSRKLLTQQLAAAASVGANGLIVHGGHVTAGTDVENAIPLCHFHHQRIHDVHYVHRIGPEGVTFHRRT